MHVTYPKRIPYPFPRELAQDYELEKIASVDGKITEGEKTLLTKTAEAWNLTHPEKAKEKYANSTIKLANGGDRNQKTTPEKEYCEKNNIETIWE